jgi:hypothetical protein
MDESAIGISFAKNRVQVEKRFRLDRPQGHGRPEDAETHSEFPVGVHFLGAVDLRA